MTSDFFQVQLRTLDVEAARDFYSTVLGAAPLQLVPLHEQAVARGARPHWLGYLRVADVEQAAQAFLGRGAQMYATWVNPEGAHAAVMRDPGGAIVALAKPPAADWTCTARSGLVVDSFVLNTSDVTRAKVNYGELFGWEFLPPLDLGALGVLHPFTWAHGAARAGSLIDIAGRPSVHPHWLYHFRVPALTRAIEAVRAAGGAVIGPLALPDGEQVAVCDDPQGAAFALIARAS
jgi:predicted enzyme related to lactoylglutathione lyase